MIPFLKSVAKAYTGRYDDLSGFCFVFPNKRSGTFFLKYLRSEMKEGRVAPLVTTITDFVSETGDSVIDNRISALFTLYECYFNLLPSDRRPEFDSFRTWGETVLSDFNEVGMNCQDPGALFKNLHDHKEIASDFLTEEQKKIMEEYFGQSVSDGDSFWRHFNNGPQKGYLERDEDGKIPLRNRFLKLWETLAPLYESFNQALADKGLTTTSGAYRAALSNIKERGREALGWEKVVFVGFNALTHIELDIFRTLQKLGTMDSGPHPEDSFADFIWDATGPVFKRLREQSQVRKNSAARFVIANRLRFPEPDWAREVLSKSDVDRLPAKLVSIGAPSNAIQAKIAAEEVKKVYDANSKSKISNARVAVVLPDENLLLPFLYALPEEINDVNLTMGYPLKLTSVVSFVSQLRQVIRSSREKHGVTLFYLPDLAMLMSHPLAKAIAGAEATETFIRNAETRHEILVPLTILRSDLPALDEIFAIPPRDADPVAVADYLENVLVKAENALAENATGLLKTGLDSKHIESYRQGLISLRTTLKRYGIKMDRDTVLSIVQRLVGNQRVSFEGEPLRGLQVMGLLETRSLDFDTVIIPSLNERILPLKSRPRTFIPNSLRSAYGLPPANYAENLFAYYFYRLISRAKEVIMIHDARAGAGIRVGGVSRYVHQLAHIFAHDELKIEERTFTLTDFIPRITPILKTDKVRNYLQGYLSDHVPTPDEKRRVLSASAVNDYCKCEKLFFYKYVVRIPDLRPATLHIDHIQLGNIVHKVMEKLYKPGPEGPVKVTPQFVDELIQSSNTRLLKVVTEAMIEELKFLKNDTYKAGFPPDYEIVRSTIVKMVRGILLTDRQLAADSGRGYFEVLGTETQNDIMMTTGKGREIRFRYAIDRIDNAGGNLRIVDYKTGAIHAAGRDFDEMFDENSVSMTNFLQLMAYAGIVRRIMPEESAGGVGMVLYSVTEMTRDSKSDENLAIIKPKFRFRNPESGREEEKVFETDDFVVYNKKVVLPGKKNAVIERIEQFGSGYRDEFNERLAAKIDTIFDNPEFVPTRNPRNCANCSYAVYCLR